MTRKIRVLVTGANGFVGSALLKHLSDIEQIETVAVVRSKAASSEVSADQLVGGVDFSKPFDLRKALKGVDCVVHCAARVHVMRDRTSNPLAEFRKVNVAATEELARQALACGVGRFIFISSVKVNGDCTSKKPFFIDDPVRPCSAYALSKYEAECIIRDTCSSKGAMSYTIIRPPMVYGCSVSGNFKALTEISNSIIPLPFGLVKNQRSLVFVGNLVHLIAHCLTHDGANNQIFFVSDTKDVSTGELVREIRLSLNRTVNLFPLPISLLKTFFSIIGKEDLFTKLCGSLQVDISHTKKMLDWAPPFSFSDGIRSAVDPLRNY